MSSAAGGPHKLWRCQQRRILGTLLVYGATSCRQSANHCVTTDNYGSTRDPETGSYVRVGLRALPLWFIREVIDYAYPRVPIILVGWVNVPIEDEEEVKRRVQSHMEQVLSSVPIPSFAEAVSATGMKNKEKIIERCRNIVAGLDEREKPNPEAACAVALYTLNYSTDNALNPSVLLNRALLCDTDLWPKWCGVIALLVSALKEMEPCLVLSMYMTGCFCFNTDSVEFWLQFSSATTDIDHFRTYAVGYDPNEVILSLGGMVFDLKPFSGKSEYLVVPGRRYSIVKRRSSSVAPLLDAVEQLQTGTTWPPKAGGITGQFRRVRRDIIQAIEPEWVFAEPASAFATGQSTQVMVQFKPPGMPYSQGFFIIKFTLPSEYPFRAPLAQLVTPIHHPILNTRHPICSCLVPALGSWSPQVTIMTVMKCIRERVNVIDSWSSNKEEAQAQMQCADHEGNVQAFIANREEFLRQAELLVKQHASQPQLPAAFLYL
ncbi:hypothetical protein Pelo_13260 [Pelomyxa schiedti]|nr:hypothetical protein Pelo_13260 [Pelomyxa schiedti]